MKKKLITDIDFIHNYRDEEKYNLLYGILYHIGTIEKEDELSEVIYRLLVNLVHKQCSNILANVKVKKWISLYNEVIEILNSYDNEVLVTVPFCGLFDYPIVWLREHYCLAKDILIEFERTNCEGIEYIDDNLSTKSYPIPPMWDLFHRVIEIGKLNLNDDDNLGKRELLNILREEMERRFASNRRVSYFDTTKKIRPCSDKENEYLHHIYDGDRAIYKKYEFEVTQQIKKDGGLREASSETNTNLMSTGVIYFLIDAMLKETVPNDIKKKLTERVVDFFSDREGKNTRNLSTIHRYLNCKLEEADFINKTFKKDFIKGQLNRYKLTIPSILDD